MPLTAFAALNRGATVRQSDAIIYMIGLFE
jgi:hypothetical protein